MNVVKTESSGPANYELRFQSLPDAGRAYVFPCDAAGHVDMDALTDADPWETTSSHASSSDMTFPLPP